jgi:hypothetical protein
MSRQQLEAAYRGVLDRQMLEALDEAWDIACESEFHDGNDPVEAPFHGGPATHFVKGPCVVGFRCGVWVEAVRTYGFTRCDEHRRHGISEIHLIPIAPRS